MRKFLLAVFLALALPVWAQNEVKFTAYDTSGADFLTAVLNSLADDAWYLSAAIDPQGGTNLGDMYVDFFLELGAPGAARDGGPVELWLLVSLDSGTTYPSGCSSADPSGAPNCLFFPSAVDEAWVTQCRALLQPVDDYKICLQNTTGQAFKATDNILSYLTYTVEIN